MHEAGYRALGLAFTYVPFEVRDLPGAIAGMRGLGIRGFGVSHPFKQAVMPLLDALDPVAERIGAVNTIVNTDGRLVGHNTDWIGATRALEQALEGVRPLPGARVLLLGAGGAARAIAFGIRERGQRNNEGAFLAIANRDPKKAAALAADAGAEVLAWDDRVEKAPSFDVVVNATSLGQSDVDPSASALPAEALPTRPGSVVMDIVYKPIHTPLLAAAAARGCTVVHGGQMLLHQATAQFELYTGHKAPLEAMLGALRAAVGD
jgi:shikimate dehydrogenase